MSHTEFCFRWVVIKVAQKVPRESPGWATLGIFAPIFISVVVIHGTLESTAANSVIATFFTKRQLFWTEVGMQTMMGFFSFVFLCRLLQICDSSYFDSYKLEESQ